MMRNVDNSGIVRTVYSTIFRDIQQRSAMFRHIDTYSATLTGMQLRGMGEAYPALFLKIEKSVRLWVNFSFQNVVLRVYKRKNYNFF